LLRFFRRLRPVRAYFAQQPLAAKTQNLLFLRIAHPLPVKTFLTAAETAATVAALIGLTYSPARALHREKF